MNNKNVVSYVVGEPATYARIWIAYPERPRATVGSKPRTVVIISHRHNVKKTPQSRYVVFAYLTGNVGQKS